MSRWRAITLVLLVLLLGIPLGLPFVELLAQRDAWRVWEDAPRILLLAKSTAWLCGGTLLVALPAGTLAAFLLYRTDLPGARWWIALIVLTLFVPLPLFASAWQAALGAGGLMAVGPWATLPETPPEPGEVRPLWKPWAQGLAAAVWVHAVAALPWVILIVGQGLCWVERELEEDALTAAGPWKVVWRVTLLRCRAALGVAALWVVLMTATEITVVDMMQVRTVAEEVYLQFGRGEDAAVARTLVAALPALLLACILLIGTIRRWERTLPPLERAADSPRVYALGAFRLPCLVLILTTIAALVLVPVGALVWRAGLAGSPETWSVRVVAGSLQSELRGGWGKVALSLGVSLATGAAAAGLGLVVCWLAQGISRFRRAVLVLLASAWVLPAPVVGIGLKEAIHYVLDLEEALYGAYLDHADRPFYLALFGGPSGVPIFWAYLIRFFPFAVAVQWPVVRQIPQELRDAIRVEGATPWQELRHLVVPLCWPACLRAALAVAVLSLGEIGASKLVWAGWTPFAHEVFQQMHTGVGNTLAAMCLVLLGMVMAGGAVYGFAPVSAKP